MLKTTTYGDITRFDLARTLPGRGRYWTVAYLVDGMMIDTGCPFTGRELGEALAGMPLTRIVNTHTHEDHIGGNGPLQRQRGDLEILAHPLGLPVLADPRKEQPLHPYRRVVWGWPEPCRAGPVADEAVIETPRYRFQCLYTPGHSRDHVCLYEPQQGWLFSGDLFVGGWDRGLRSECDIWAIITSLKQMAALSTTTLFPGSARVRDNPALAIRTKITYLEELGEAVLALDRRGWSVPAIARALCGGPMLIELITLGHFSRRQLVRSYLRQGTD